MTYVLLGRAHVVHVEDVAVKMLCRDWKHSRSRSCPILWTLQAVAFMSWCDDPFALDAPAIGSGLPNVSSICCNVWRLRRDQVLVGLIFMTVLKLQRVAA